MCEKQDIDFIFRSWPFKSGTIAARLVRAGDDREVLQMRIEMGLLQMELAGLAKDNDSGRPTKAQRQEAKEAVEQRCSVEAATGKFRKMQQFPILWDLQQQVLYFGGSVGTAAGHCLELIESRFLQSEMDILL